MIELAKALEITLRAASRLPADRPEEEVPLAEALGRALTRQVTSPIDSPPFDKAAMDGFAVRLDDQGREFRILETLAAGGVPGAVVRTGECARIMTGAMLPPGAGRVIPRELVEEMDGRIRLAAGETATASTTNVVPRGENLRRGDLVLGPRILRPQDIGILAASGIARIRVAVPPRAGIIATGGEIRVPGEPLAPGEIYDSNSMQLAAQLATLRVPARSFGIVPDSPGRLEEAIGAALDVCDLVMLTGGVSAGDFDFVPASLEALGAEILFHKVAIKPGKPTLFARRSNRFVFGMPGNPVSSFVIFEVFVRPFLHRLMGVEWEEPRVRGRLATAARRRSTDRDEFLPVRVKGTGVELLRYHGSADLNAFRDANGLILVPRGVAGLPEGTEVDVRLL